MRQLSFAILMCFLLALSHQGFAQPKTKAKEDKTKTKNMDMNNNNNAATNTNTSASMNNSPSMGSSPYTASYSSQFEIDDPMYANKVLEVWKDYEENQLARHRDYISDTVMVVLPDGTTYKGEAAGNAIQGFRAMNNDVKVKMIAWVPLLSKDRNEHVVLVWADETDTDKNGNSKTSRIHEVWGFNKDGKIDYIAQYEAMPEKHQ